MILMPSQGFWETGKQGHLFQWNKEMSINKGNTGTKAILGNREHRKSFFSGNRGNRFTSAEQGNMASIVL